MLSDIEAVLRSESELVRLLHQRYQDMGDTLARKAAWRIEELEEIEHLVWHVLDDSEEDAQTGIITLAPSDDLKRLSALLPEGHPPHA